MKKLSYILLLSLLFLAGCKTNPTSESALQCHSSLEEAKKEQNFARAKGFNGTVDYAKASALITGASIQYEIGKYLLCIDKIKRARKIIKRYK